MQIDSSTAHNSRKMTVAGWVVGGIPSLLMLIDGGAKLFKPAPVVEATVKLGFPESSIVGMGIALLASTLLYLYPRTAALGAILLTGYFGGAVCVHVHENEGWFPILFPAFFAALFWGGLWLRDWRVRALLPLRS